jgi:putative ATP-dependent endonuclease of the OLD family
MLKAISALSASRRCGRSSKMPFAAVPRSDIDDIASEIQAATTKLGHLAPINEMENVLRTDIHNLAGTSQDLRATLGFSSTDPQRLFRAIALYIDDGKRGINEVSLGSANVALLALKLAEFAWRRAKNERNYTLLIVEEPEAHLHPHLQRNIFHELLAAPPDEPRALFVTTHPPAGLVDQHRPVSETTFVLTTLRACYP